MRVLFTSLRDTGHFLPLVPFIRACRERGHEVAVAAPPDLSDRVASTGAEFLPFGHPGDEGLRPLWAKLRQVPAAEMNRVVISEIFAGMCAEHALPKLLETLEKWQPSIVVRESQEYAAVLASAKLQIPRARISIMMRSVEHRLAGYAAPTVEAHAQRLGLASHAAAGDLLREPSLSLFPAAFDLAESEQASVRRFHAPQGASVPLPSWWGAQDGPLVYFTLGTVAGGLEEGKAIYKHVLEAVSTLPVRVLLTIGKNLPLEALGELPANVHVERFVPQENVLPHAAAVVCHGGSGTVIGSLAAGVPMVVTPLGADQPDNAARVQACGAGLSVGTRDARVEETRRAVSRVLDEPAFRLAARRLAAEISALPPIGEAPAELERIAGELS